MPNGSFEEHDTCPTMCSTPGDPQIERCNGWYSPNLATSDFLNSCADLTSGVNIPNTFWGYQQAYNGNGSVGIYSYNGEENYREYVQCKLIKPLQKNIEYYLEFYVCLAKHSYCGINRMGAYFSQNKLYQNDYYFISANPQVSNPVNQILSDTMNWTKISGTFISNGDENYMTIGNFFDISETDTTPFFNRGFIESPYYYIDGVQLTEVQSSIDAPNVFTPNNDGINDFFEVKTKSLTYYNCIIYSRWGNIVYESKNPFEYWGGYSANKDKCSEGTYFYIITAKGIEGKEYNIQGSVQLLL